MKDAQWFSKLYKDQFQKTWNQIEQDQPQRLSLSFADFVRIELGLYVVETKFPDVSAQDFGYLLQGIPVKSLQPKKKLINRLRGYLRNIRSQGVWQEVY